MTSTSFENTLDGTRTRDAVRVGLMEALDAELLAHGGYAPLTGFMNKDEYRAVVETLHLPNGAVFPLPVVLPIAENIKRNLKIGDTLAIASEEGCLANIRVTDIFFRDREREAKLVYGTVSQEHPGVSVLFEQSPWCVAGPVTIRRPAFQKFQEPLWPHQVKAWIRKQGFKTVTFFQTRNPTHRAHEHMLKMALEITDGLVVHPLVGPTKSDDVPSAIRMHTYRALIDTYFPKDRTLLATFGAAMRYAGPREAAFHGLVRRNYGATHFIVGRDAAGVGGFYSPDGARLLFESLSEEMGLVPLTFDKIGYCPKCLSMASLRSCPHSNAWFSMSGTMVRELLSRGQRPPLEVMRPEIADILVDGYRDLEG